MFAAFCPAPPTLNKSPQLDEIHHSVNNMKAYFVFQKEGS